MLPRFGDTSITILINVGILGVIIFFYNLLINWMTKKDKIVKEKEYEKGINSRNK